MKSARPLRRVGDVLLYENEPVYLAGCLPGNVDLPDPPGPKLDALDAHRNNFWRHWMIAYYLYSKSTPIEDPKGTFNYPPDHAGRARNCPFKYYLPREEPGFWNLLEYNEDYFRRLRLTIEAAAARGIVVEISLFDACGLGLDSSDKLRRWPHSPFNSINNRNQVVALAPGETSGIPGFYRDSASLRDILKKYIAKVVSEVKAYWNVTFEIMNEPRGDAELKVKWADFVTGVLVSAYAGSGKPVVFYNTYPNNRAAADMNDWWTRDASNHGEVYAHCADVAGVTFHGDPSLLDPDATTYAFRSAKVFQGSADGGPSPARDTHDFNKKAAEHLLHRDALFQGWSTDEEAFKGVQDTVPAPTPLLADGLTYEWRKVLEQPSGPAPDHFHLRVFKDGSYTTFDEPYAPLEQGVVRDYPKNRQIKLFNATRNTESLWDFSLLDHGATLRLVRASDGFRQDFTRFSQPSPAALAPFLYHFRKISESQPTPVPDFHLRFFADGSFRTFRVSPLRPLPYGEVRVLDAQHITLTRYDNGQDVVWSYTLAGNRLTLVRANDGYQQVFERFERPAVDALVPLLHPWDKISESPHSPLVPDRFRLRFLSDGSFATRAVDAPYAELERGEVRSLTLAPADGSPAKTGKLVLWSHTRSIETTYDIALALDADDKRTLSLTNPSGFRQTFVRG